MTYSEFIENILATRGRFGCGEQYHERHHILPKSHGGENPRAKRVIYLVDGTVYGCIKDAAAVYGINKTSFRKILADSDTEFMLYDKWLLQNRSESTAC